MLPTGTITFLFTDVVGNVPIWERDPAAMKVALGRHHDILQAAARNHHGQVFKIIGDEFQIAFEVPENALEAVLEVQRALHNEPWGATGSLTIRTGLHTGPAEVIEGVLGTPDYAVSHTINRVARIRSAAHGGQILLSSATAELLHGYRPEEIHLRDLGECYLKGMSIPEHVFQVVVPDLPDAFPPLLSIYHPLHNLPPQRTAFVGRQAQIAQVKALLEQHRLVTLTGSGGVGKTRLALQVAEEVLTHFPEGVWLVELAAVIDPALVPQTVATTLGLKSRGSQPISDILLDYLHNQQTLLVLDNCEHLIEACAALTDTILNACPRVKILASSREALGVVGEMPFRVPSLTLPDLRPVPDLADLEQSEAICLFSECAMITRPGFQVTADNAAAVAQVGLRLDGIPLAIELAASRLNVLTVDQLAHRLDNAFRLLTGGARTALPRQQTLRATIDWSYQLLSARERDLFRRLAVFLGSFDLQALEAVCTMDEVERAEVLDVLASLVNKSMLIAERQPRLGMRYHLLETVRQYAREKLNDSGESLPLHDRHASYYLDEAAQCEDIVHSLQAADWLRRMDADFSNIRAALGWALDGPAPEKAISTAQEMRTYWIYRGIIEEGCAWLEKALRRVDTTQPSLALAGLKFRLGELHSFLGRDSAKAYEHIAQARAMYQDLGDRFGYARATQQLAKVVFDMYGKDIARKMSADYFAESVAIFRELGAEKDLAFALFEWGLFTRLFPDDLEEARSMLEESERICCKLGSSFIGGVRAYLGWVYWKLGQPGRARSLFQQGLAALRAVEDHWGLKDVLQELGELELEDATDSAGLHKTEAILLESLEHARKFGIKNLSIATISSSLATASMKLGEYPLALKRFQDGLIIIHEVCSSAWYYQSGIGWFFMKIAEVAVNLKEVTFSARLLGAVPGLRASAESLWDEKAKADFERITAQVRSQLEEADFQSAWNEGSSFTLDEAVAYALEGHE